MLYFTDIQISLLHALHSNDIFNRDDLTIFHILNKMATNTKLSLVELSLIFVELGVGITLPAVPISLASTIRFFLHLDCCLRTETYLWLASRSEDLMLPNDNTLSIISCIVNLNSDSKLQHLVSSCTSFPFLPLINSFLSHLIFVHFTWEVDLIWLLLLC